MSKHTPGPWTWREHVPNHCKVGTTEMSVADVNLWSFGIAGTRDECEANARLIAAAPDLLEALIWMVENDETNEGDTPMPDHYGQTWNEINAYWLEGLNKARAAIAKATGEGA